ncbi:MAG: hypothetical protein ACRC8Z_02635 [Empedobacter falsenii]
MKNFLKHILIITIFFSFSTLQAADLPQPCEPGFDCSGGGEETGGGLGGRKVPINDYVPLLVITAISIAGIVSYKQRLIIKK